MGGTRFMVQWEEHPSHLATRLGQLLEHQTLVDVTLMCNTHTLRVHRAVLAACSPYFESILQRQLGAHPLIVLKDMQFSVLKSLIEFMYCGETSVTEDNLGSLLQAAKFFQVKGLSSMTKEALGLPASPAKSTPVNGESVKKGPGGRPSTASKRMGMQTTLVSTAEVMNKQINASSSTTTIATSVGSQQRVGPGGDSAAVKIPSAQAASSITTDTAQLLLNLSGTDPTMQQQTLQPVQPQSVQIATSRVAVTTTTQARPLLQMSSRNVRVSNLRGSNVLKVDSTKALLEKSKTGEVSDGSHIENVETPRRRGRPLKKQINVMFQEKVMTDAEIALQKEADASRLALEALKKEMNTGDPGNAEAVAAELVASESEEQPQPTQQEVDQQEQQEAEALMEVGDGSEQTSANSEIVYQVTPDGQVVATSAGEAGTAAGNVTSYMEALKEAGLPTDLPILLDSGDGSYVTVNEEVLMNICNGGVLHYQVAEGNLVQGMDGQVMLQEGENETSQEQQQQQIQKPATSQAPIIQQVPEVKPMGKRPNRVVTPAGGCGFTTARQIVKASMDKYRQEQAGLRKFVVKEMQAAELILDPDDHSAQQQQQQQEQEQEQEQQEQLLASPAEQQATITVDGHTLVQSEGGQVQALLQTFDGDGEGQQEMVYLVTENPDEVITGDNYEEATHGFAVVADGSTVEGAHAFSLEDGSIVVQEGHVAEGTTEMSVEQALEAMMGSDATDDTVASTVAGGAGGTVVVSESGEIMAVSQAEAGHTEDSESMRLVLSPDSDEKSNSGTLNLKGNEEEGPTETGSQDSNVEGEEVGVLSENQKLEATLSLDDLNQDAVSSPSKDIPLAVGLLPLKTALERIQSTPDHQPRKTRSASISGQPGEGQIKRKIDSPSEAESLEKKARTEGEVDGESLVNTFETDQETVTNYVVDPSLGVITDDGLKDAQ